MDTLPPALERRAKVASMVNHAKDAKEPLPLRWRADLRVEYRSEAGREFYIIEDVLRGTFHHLGVSEYEFARRLDGTQSLHESVEAFATHCEATLEHFRLGQASAFSLESAQQLVIRLEQLELLEPLNPTSRSVAHASATPRKTLGTIEKWIVAKIVWPSPDLWLKPFVPWTKWMFGPIGFLIWLAVLAIAGTSILNQWSRFQSASEGVFAPSNWLIVLASWIVLKLVHETAHAIACIHYGGHVKEWGIQWVAFTPMAFVDVTSSWRLKRWERMIVSFAGIYADLAIAAFAAITWSHVGDGWLAHACYVTFMTAGVGTLLMNANPLMRFDGYFLLSDGIGVPNLYSRSNTLANQWLLRSLTGLGNDASHQPIRSPLQRYFILYGLATKLWRASVTIGLIAAFHSILGNLTFVLVGLVIAERLRKNFSNGLPIVAWWMSEFPRMAKTRLIATTVVGTLILAGLFWLPWPGILEAPAIIDYANAQVVRSDETGFVQRVDVESRQWIRSGETILLLENEELRGEQDRLHTELQQSELRCLQHEHRNELSQLQQERIRFETLKMECEVIDRRVEGLQLKADRDGRVVARRLPEWKGRYVSVGQPLMTIATEESKELRVYLPESAIRSVTSMEHPDISLMVFPDIGEAWSIRLDRILPRAIMRLDEPSLSASCGGRLEVRRIENPEGRDGESTFELFEPRFVGIAKLPREISSTLASGTTATACLRPYDESIANHWLRQASKWLHHLFHKASQPLHASSCTIGRRNLGKKI